MKGSNMGSLDYLVTKDLIRGNGFVGDPLMKDET
jgi:hypothetical protein